MSNSNLARKVFDGIKYASMKLIPDTNIFIYDDMLILDYEAGKYNFTLRIVIQDVHKDESRVIMYVHSFSSFGHNSHDTVYTRNTDRIVPKESDLVMSFLDVADTALCQGRIRFDRIKRGLHGSLD